jgi:hypothetical protein
MRSIFSLFFLLLSYAVGAQETFLDTFIRKDGIYTLVPFTEREPRTLFAFSGSKKKSINEELSLGKDLSEKVKAYLSPSFGKQEPYVYFRVVRDLEAHDSASYYQGLAELPTPYQNFFSGLYLVELNNFKDALPKFDDILNSGNSDSLLLRESKFWKDATQKLLSDDIAYKNVLSAYAASENPTRESYPKLLGLVERIQSPYLLHRYLIQYNYLFRINDYDSASKVYDSVVLYAVPAKMKASLTKNRDAVVELLQAKKNFIKVAKNKLYHYDIDFLYDHLDAWGANNLTDREILDEAGFTLSKKYSTKSDSIFTRWLKDTTLIDTLSKFEVLSFIKTPLDKGNRRFVIVKLGFDNEKTYKEYETFLSRFKSKPIFQSIYYNSGPLKEGEEYMLTKNFIAALYKQNDPIIKYELSLYLIEDSEGNVYGVDTLFN